MAMFSEQFLQLVRDKARAVRGKEKLAKMVGCSRNHLYDFINEEKMLSADLFLRLCEALGVRDLKAVQQTAPVLAEEPEAVCEEPPAVPLFGYVAAGVPGAPADAVLIEDDVARISIAPETWSLLFPGVDPRGLAALRIAGSSMSPRHHEGDIIFVRRTEDQSAVYDGQQVVIYLPGDGHTFKVWRDTGVLEGINPSFKPIPCPRGARLWGVYVCGTKTE